MWHILFALSLSLLLFLSFCRMGCRMVCIEGKKLNEPMQASFILIQQKRLVTYAVSWAIHNGRHVDNPVEMHSSKCFSAALFTGKLLM